MNIRYKIIGFFTFFFLFFTIANAQPARVLTSLDKNEIVIGEQLKLKVELFILATNYKTQWLSIPDSLGHFEVIARSKVDSVYDNDRLFSITQTFTLTSFDSGKWVIPSFPVNFYSLDSPVNTLHTDS